MARLGMRLSSGFKKSFEQILLKQDLSIHRVANSLHQQGRRIVFHENSSNSFANHSGNVSIVHTCRDKEHFSFEAYRLKIFEKVGSLLGSKIQVQQNHVDFIRLEDSSRLYKRT